MANVTKKDLVQVQAAERQRGTLKRNSATVKNSDGNDITGNLFYVVDDTRKQASREYLYMMLPVLKAYKAVNPKGYETLKGITLGFTQLVKAENETNNLYKIHREFGRKSFGTLDYFPYNDESMLLVLGSAYAAVKEERIAKAEISRKANAQKREKDTISNASTETLAQALSIEQLQAALAKAQAAAAEKENK